MMDLVLKMLARAHLCFPSFGDRTKADIIAMAGVFCEQIEKAGIAADVAEKAFDHHMRTAREFPTIADIVGATRTETCYKLDYGPLGFGAIYHASHPYVRYQMRIPGVNLSRFAVEVSAIDAERVERIARHAPPLEVDDDDAPPAISRGNGSFRRISFDG